MLTYKKILSPFSSNFCEPKKRYVRKTIAVPRFVHPMHTVRRNLVTKVFIESKKVETTKGKQSPWSRLRAALYSVKHQRKAG